MSDYLVSLRDRLQADLSGWERKVRNLKCDVAEAEAGMRQLADNIAEIDAAIVALGKERETDLFKEMEADLQTARKSMAR